jgi:ATP-dependent Clp protease ATP-binding subunit ClpA
MTSQSVDLDLPFIPEAAAEAAKLGHPYLAPEHLFLVAVKEAKGATATFCQRHDINTQWVRASIIDVIGPVSPRPDGVPRLAQRSLVALSRAIQSGRGRPDSPFSLDDLFLSLVSEDVASGAVVGSLLERHGLTPTAARAEMEQIRRDSPAT